MIRSVIVEDEHENAQGLKNLLLRFCPDVQVLAIAQNEDEAVEAILEHHPDLVFLDIRLSGVELAGFRILDRTDMLEYEVIFVTGYPDYWLLAKNQRRAVLHYLVKPYQFEELVMAVNKAVDLIRVKNQAAIPPGFVPARQRLALPHAAGLELVWVKDIVRCQAEGSYTFVWLTGEAKCLLVTKNLGWFVQKLPPDRFVRAHNSHLVNIHYVRSYYHEDGGILVLSDLSRIQVGAKFKAAVLERLHSA